MRQEQRPIAAALSAVEFKFRFQMRDAGAQRACSVTFKLSLYTTQQLFPVRIG